jgi:hypothetical protein
LKLGFFKDYLCVLVGCGRRIVADIWLMNVYGKRESWTKTVTVPYMGYNDYHTNINKALYISDDDQVLLEFNVANSMRKHTNNKLDVWSKG